MTDIFKHYEEFYIMVLSATVMSNSRTPELDADAKRIIRFIGDSYGSDPAFTDYCTEVVLEKLSPLALITDQRAVYSVRSGSQTLSDEDALFDVKGDVLVKLQSMGDTLGGDVNPSWFDYSHYKTYQPHIRFYKISMTSATGNIIATRQVGILQMLGIGCEANIPEAIVRFTQCAFWGDIPSMHMLSHAYELSGDKKNAKLYAEVAELSHKYLNAGYTVLPAFEEKKYSADACKVYAWISTIKQDIVHAFKKYDIDLSFVEAITTDDMDDFKRMDYINNYDRKEWKNVTHSSEKPVKELGFNRR